MANTKENNKTRPVLLLLGATSDIAQAVAKRYASRGYDLMLTARNTERLSPIEKDLKLRYGTDVQSFDLDAIDYPSHASFIDQLPGTPDVVVCAIGYLGDHDLAETDANEAARIMEINYNGPVGIIQPLSMQMKARGNGCIIGISSVAGERGRQSNYFYGSAKAAFSTYLDGLRNRLCRHGVHVATIKPGYVYTGMTAHMKLPPSLTASPEQVARAIWRAHMNKKGRVYVLGRWRLVMGLIKAIPDRIFKRMKL